MEKVFTEHASGAKVDRPELAAVLDYLRPGDTLKVWKLDRLGRSLPHLIQIITDLDARDIEFVSLTEGFDTRTAMGRLIFQIMGGLAEFERELIRERTIAGLAVARANGRFGGRRRVLNGAQVRQVLRMRDEKIPVAEIARVFGCGRATVYRVLDAA
ncbi:recombinase family protein [Fodinicola feengrottensis]|uniref:recombinase family protein n=1 Tax=Fodinicola feengrottensis TaxID=435914 RepID=UPI0028BF4EFE|nr:recombinase family protein [Fodinicola feengrottensis]